MRFFCERYPQLYVRDLGVRFKNGVYETDDEAIAERLRNAALPIVCEGGEECKPTSAEQKQKPTSPNASTQKRGKKQVTSKKKQP